MWLHLALALASAAAPVQSYPILAPVTLPAGDVVRIEVPVELRPSFSATDTPGLLLVDASGEAVPVAVIEGSPRWERFGEDQNFRTTPLPDGKSWALDLQARAIDGIEITLPTTPSTAAARIYETTGGTRTLVAEAAVWRLGTKRSPPLPMPAHTGQFHIELESPYLENLSGATFTGIRDASIQAAPSQIRVEIGAPVIQENGWARYEVPLPGAMPIDRVHLEVTETLFERNASALLIPAQAASDALPVEAYPYNTTVIQRLHLGGERLEQLALPLETSEGNRLVILVKSDGRAPLQISAATVEVDAMHLFVNAAIAGDYTLYGGFPDGDMTSDLQFAAPELARMATASTRPGHTEPNRAYVPPEMRGDLGAPGLPLDLKQFRYRRAIEGEPGLTRIPLPLEVLTHARPDLGDLRAVTPELTQVPYVVVTDGVLHDWGSLPYERTERKGTSYLEVALPESNALVGTVTLRTGASTFQRPIRISQQQGVRLVPMRAVDWVGTERPDSLTLEVFQRVGDTLVVEIDNGNDSPLPIDAIEVSWPGYDLITVLPEGGASLVYGDPRIGTPDYDLRLVYRLEDRAELGGTLGPMETLTRPPAAFFDRAVVGLGILVMSLGLLGLTVVLIRGAPAKDPAPDTDEDEDEDDKEEDDDKDAEGLSPEVASDSSGTAPASL